MSLEADTEACVCCLRLLLLQCRGKNIPKPIRAWTQAGLSGKMLEVLKKGGFERPLPIQAQAMPIIMSGR